MSQAGQTRYRVRPAWLIKRLSCKLDIRWLKCSRILWEDGGKEGGWGGGGARGRGKGLSAILGLTSAF